MHTLSRLALAALLLTPVAACVQSQAEPQPAASSGVRKAEVQVQTGTDGLTAEQRNVRDRLVEDNKPGAIKHLYVISAYSGQVILYSTVRGKVTSSGKRLTPTTVAAIGGQYNFQGDYVPVVIGGQRWRTAEVLQDDGTYGSSDQYIYWWDTKGAYHQHYISGGQIVHVSSQPLAVPKILINVSAAPATPESR